jgi:hypothetical protein
MTAIAANQVSSDFEEKQLEKVSSSFKYAWESEVDYLTFDSSDVTRPRRAVAWPVNVPIRALLLADVLADLLQFKPDRGNGITAGPELLAREISILAAQPGNRDRALSFEKTDHRGHGVFRWNRDAHMYMVWHQMTFHNLAFLLPCQRVEDRTQLPSRLPKDGLPASLGHEYYVVLAVPSGMG